MASDDSARTRWRAHNFTYPWTNLFWTLVFIGVVTSLIVWLFPQVREAFQANVFINGTILVVLAFGCLYALVQILGVFEAAGWLKKFQTASVYEDLSRPPAVIAPMAELLAQSPSEVRLNSVAARSMLDSVGARMGEAGEITRYLARLLIFLGLLGTFWGLLLTLGGVVEIVTELANASEGDGSIAALFATIQEPLEGMGTAFSSSIFGIAGSLVLGFLDLQASQAQNRFYNEVEDWLAKISRLGVANEGGGAGSAAYASAVLEQMADGLDELGRLLRKGEETRIRTAESMTFLSTELAALNDRLARQEEALLQIRDKVADASMGHHLRNVDNTLQRFAADMTNDRDAGFREMRTELRALANAIARLIEPGERR
ncbi:MAG: hypothetical protein MI723_15780 [Caulobacterales bacterium]|nr:hypothetical protein [Caulobacterales bacterium]